MERVITTRTGAKGEVTSVSYSKGMGVLTITLKLLCPPTAKHVGSLMSKIYGDLGAEDGVCICFDASAFTQNDAKDAGWNDGVAANCHQFTAEAGENVKYVSPDGKREAIYDSNGILVTSDEDVGTYNYIPSGNVFESVGHFFVDILPWIIWGNSEKDPTLPGDRFASMFGG